MALNAAALEIMVEKGLSASDILDIARALEVRRDNTAAERQQRRREKVKAQNNRDESRRDVTRDAPPNDIYSNPPPEPQSANADCPPFSEKQAISVWNEMAERRNLSVCRSLAGDRLSRCRRRLAEHGETGWREAVLAVEKSRWLLGETGKDGWKANIDFLLVPKHFAKLIEGGYGNDAAPSAGAGQRVTAEQHRQTQLDRAALYDRMGRTDEADQIRRELGIEKPPDAELISIGAHDFGRRLRA